MEGIAKTAQPEVQPVTAPAQGAKTPQLANVMDGVNFEVYRYFNINPVLDGGNEQLKEVNNWAFASVKKPSEAIRKIRTLELKMGQPALGETRLSKMHNWVRMTNMAKGLIHKRDEAVGKVRARYVTQLNDIRTTHKDKLGKINTELARIKQEYRNSSNLIRNRPLQEINNIKREYNRQITELKSIRSLYGGK